MKMRELIHHKLDKLIIAQPAGTTRLNRKATRLLRHFQQSPGFRRELISQINQNPVNFPEALSVEESIALVAIWSVTQPVDETICHLERLSREDWFHKRRDEFYTKLAQSALELEHMGLDEEASGLTNMGEKVAEMNQDKVWATRYREWIEQKLGKRIVDLPFLKQRGW